jgi:maltose alpha-D-glucosyltransferase/alpha-amylase
MASKTQKPASLPDDPLWYKDAVIYEVHLRAFYDSDGDGMGDFRGLAEKLDHLRDLGVTAVWLLPFYPSPLRDDGYDIADYAGVHSDYGTLADFKHFLREAHQRGLRVITELVLNHTSDQHPWFQRARRAPAGSSERDFYVWNDTPEKYKETRIIFKDFEASNWSWDPVANAYYWHRFYSHQPDLNYDNPVVRKAVFQAMDFWLRMGVDGLRLDAVPYLFEREGTNCENLPETHQALQELRRRVDRRFQSRMLLAEANQWPEDAVAYFGQGDECHMAFHFPLMPRMFMALRMEDRYPVIDILEQTPAIPDVCQWAVFLRNHDELTLEMVTDEERDYMYRVYAHDPQARINLGIRRRLGPLLGNDRRRVELMNGLLFSMPGTPVIYYGDEIGMGDNIYLGDRNGVRTPMQWSPDRNAGFSRANSQRLYLPVIIDPDFHYEAVNVESQQNNPNSLLWWMRRLISLRKKFKAFSRGTLEFLYPENRKVLAFVRRYENETLLVVANLSRTAQYVELDLSAFKGMVPLELLGQTEFPRVGEWTYLLTLGPHAFYWFSLEPQLAPEVEVTQPVEEELLPALSVVGSWEAVFRRSHKGALETILGKHLRARRWFGGKARRVKSTEIVDAVPVPYDSSVAYFALVQVDYTEGDPETYLLPMTFSTGERAEQLLRDSPHVVVARLSAHEGEGILHGALVERNLCLTLLDAIARRRRFHGAGEIRAWPTRAFRTARGPADVTPEPARMRAEQSNTSILFGDRLIFKLFRRLDEGVNPDLEIGLFLSDKAGFPHIPPVAGALEYRRGRGEPMTMGILLSFVANEGDAWRYTLDSLGRYFERILAQPPDQPELALPRQSVLELTAGEIPSLMHEMIGTYLESVRTLGQRTADLHVTLASNTSDPNFAPEAFTPFYQRSLYQSMRNLTDQVFELLRKRLRYLPEDARADAQRVLDQENEILGRFHALVNRKIAALRTRVHGDYHLGQVLWTGKDFVIIDFEGEPAHSLSSRRIKRSPLRDVAGMLRSFHYAAFGALYGQVHAGGIRLEDLAAREPWARLWTAWVSSAFLKSYLTVAEQGAFLPRDREELSLLLNAYLLEKAVYEVGYELNNRPDWIHLPLGGILQLLEPS